MKKLFIAFAVAVAVAMGASAAHATTQSRSIDISQLSAAAQAEIQQKVDAASPKATDQVVEASAKVRTEVDKWGEYTAGALISVAFGFLAGSPIAFA